MQSSRRAAGVAADARAAPGCVSSEQMCTQHLLRPGCAGSFEETTVQETDLTSQGSYFLLEATGVKQANKIISDGVTLRRKTM